MASLLFTPAKLTASKRFQLSENEVEYLTMTGVSISNEAKQRMYGNGTCMLSSHFLYWVDGAFKTPVKTKIQSIQQFKVHNSFFRSNGRLDLYIHSPELVSLRVEMSRDQMKHLETSLEKCMQRKAWLVEAKKDQPKAFSTSQAGVAGLMRKQQQEQVKNKTLAQEAFSDLDTLMSKAKSIVDLVDRYSSALENQKQTEAQGDSGKKSDEDEFNSLLQNMGISNPVSKKTAGSLYHEQLSREVADFLSKELQRHSKSQIIALTDLYAIVNRARGSELISPDDFVEACGLLQRLGLQFTMRRLDSGVIVVQSNQYSSAAVCAKITEMLDQHEYVTPLAVANQMSVSLSIANEMLQTAEMALVICRASDPVVGESFYKNQFPQFVEMVGELAT